LMQSFPLARIAIDETDHPCERDASGANTVASCC
jgi:hypothetical protein